MLRNITPRTPVEIIERKIEFTDASGSYGYSFDATPDGKVILENDDQRENYKYAIEHPEEFTEQYDEFVVRRRTYIEPAHGICKCGNSVVLENRYQGACPCDKCGQWYNLYGQELIDPEYWNEEENY